MKDWQAFYGSPAWKSCREAYRKKARGLCEMCLKQGQWTPGEIVHHKIELTPQNVNDPSVSLNFDNLILLCRDHHAEVHQKIQKRYKVDDLGHVIIKE